MDRNQAKVLLPIIQAYAEGSSILLATKNSYQDNTFVDGTTFGVKIEEE